MKRAIVIGVMGAGESAGERDQEAAVRLGGFIGSRGWILLCGGRNTGVMRAAVRGATNSGGLSLGLLPGHTREDSPCTVPLPTGLGSARNNVNVLASDLVVAITYNLGMGTLSEVALAVKAGKTVIMLSDKPEVAALLAPLCGSNLYITDDPAIVEAQLALQVERLLENDEPLKITMT